MKTASLIGLSATPATSILALHAGRTSETPNRLSLMGAFLLKKAFALVAALGLLASTAAAADVKDVVGIWKLNLEAPDRKLEPVLIIAKDGSGYKGEYVQEDKKQTAKDVRFEGGNLRFTITGEHDGQTTTTTFEGKVQSDAIAGDANWKFGELSGSIPFVGKRQAIEAEESNTAVGTWKLSYNPGDAQHTATLTIAKDESGLKAKFVDGDKPFEVKKVAYNDGTLTLSIEGKTDNGPSTTIFEGKIKSGSVGGEGNWSYQGMTGSFPFEGKREATKQGAENPKAGQSDK